MSAAACIILSLIKMISLRAFRSGDMNKHALVDPNNNNKMATFPWNEERKEDKRSRLAVLRNLQTNSHLKCWVTEEMKGQWLMLDFWKRHRPSCVNYTGHIQLMMPHNNYCEWKTLEPVTCPVFFFFLVLLSDTSHHRLFEETGILSLSLSLSVPTNNNK